MGTGILNFASKIYATTSKNIIKVQKGIPYSRMKISTALLVWVNALSAFVLAAPTGMKSREPTILQRAQLTRVAVENYDGKGADAIPSFGGHKDGYE